MERTEILRMCGNVIAVIWSASLLDGLRNPEDGTCDQAHMSSGSRNNWTWHTSVGSQVPQFVCRGKEFTWSGIMDNLL